MEAPYNPRIFLIIGIGNGILAGISLVGCIVLLSLSGTDSGSTTAVLFTAVLFSIIIFTQIGSLAVHQYQALRAFDEKFKKLQASFERREELSAK